MRRERWRGCARCATIWLILRSPRIMGASSSAPATAVSSSFAASSTPCAARSRCRTAWSSATRAWLRSGEFEFRVGVHLGDVVEEADGDLMGDGVNIAARLEGIAKPGAICLSEDAYRQVKGRLDLAVIDLGPIQLKNIAEPIRVYSLEIGAPAQARPAPTSAPEKSAPTAPIDGRLAIRQHRRRRGARAFRRWRHREPDDRSFTHSGRVRDCPQYGVRLQRPSRST